MGRIKTLLLIFIFALLQQNLIGQWSERRDGLPDLWSIGEAIDAIDANNAVVALRPSDIEDYKVYKTDDAGITWNEFGVFDRYFSGNMVDISMINSNRVWVATGLGLIYNTTDGGENWTTQYYDTTKTRFMNYIEMFDINNGIAMGDALNNTLPAVFLKTEDGGTSWISMNDSPFASSSGDSWRRIDFVNPQIGYFAFSVGSRYEIYKTTDGGANWNKTNFSISDKVDVNAGVHIIKFYNENIGLVYDINNNLGTDNNRVIYRTIDGGENWEVFSIASNGWGNDFEFLPNNPAKVWFTDSRKLFFSSDTGRTWTFRTVDDENSEVGRDLVFVNDSCGWVLGDDDKLFYTNNNGGTATDVRENIDEIIPTEFTLYQNYPNPFNPTTHFEYELPNKSFVNISVYNILGEKEIELVNKEQGAGSYNVSFHGANLPSGVYLIHMKAGKYSNTIKAVLAK